MLFKTRLVVFCLFIVLAVQSVWAETVYTCPDITKAVKVGDCPTEEQLLTMFGSTCGGVDVKAVNPHAKGFCKSYDMFKKVKNTALWESADGEYLGYLSCDMSEDKIKATKLLKISLGQKYVMDRIICGYEGGSELVLRTREVCKIPGAKLIGRQMGRECKPGDKDCKAICVSTQ